MEKDKIELKTLMAASEVAEYLTALAKGFKAGRIVVEKDGEHLVLSPDLMAKAEVEVEARIKKDKAKFSLELSWQLAPAGEDAAALTIGTELPKANEYNKVGDRKPDLKAEAEKTEDRKPATQDAKPAAKLAATAASAPAKSDVKPAAPAANEPGGKAAAAAQAPAKPKA